MFEERVMHIVGLSARAANGEIVDRTCYAKDDVLCVGADLLMRSQH
ncbi:hypothetical protein Mal52_13600 [Symmachiella dynata]|uniref:Uncharacterized protein n=1 Tax=Symmachiella dynata TaxID=2527995 RepID=A0A517ZK87_9PLAN|nr:hypothetical protein Mal52_13600 [Symmachiella dynata]